MIPYLYTVVDQTKLQEMLRAFHCCTNLPVQVIDENGAFLDSQTERCPYCEIFRKYTDKEHSCEKTHQDASQYAISLGETYIFTCPANLNHIIFPLMNRTTLFGSILVGPFLMDKPDAIMLSEISKRYPIPTDNLLELYDEAQNIPVISPAITGQISKLLYYLFSNLMSESRQIFMEKQERLQQQSKINESIQMYKSQIIDATPSYPLEKEQDLITKVKNGNISDAKGILNDLLGYVLFVDGGRLETIKSRSLELCTLLSRASIEGGGASDIALNLNTQFIQKIASATSYEAICFILQEIVETFADNILSHGNIKNRDIIKKAVNYIGQHYSDTLTLDDVAGHVHLNPAYFSTMFKKEMNLSFKEYLNHVRIEESKRLLTNSNFSIIDIAIAVGFEDQSYFSKVFKKYTGMTPKQFR